MRRGLSGLVVVVLVLLGSPALAFPPADTPRVGAVVVVAVNGLRWSEITDTATPALAELHRLGASGVLSIKTAAAADCAVAGLLTLGAGNRVDPVGGCAAPADARSLPAQVRHNAKRREGAVPGSLAQALRGHGDCLAGADAAAALAAADPTGVVGGRPGASCSALLRVVSAAEAEVVVGMALRERAADTLLLVLGLPDARDAAAPHLHAAMALGPGFGPGALVSASTRRAPYVQLVDVAPTVLRALGVAAPSDMIGEPWRSTAASPSLSRLRDADVLATAQRRVTVPFFVVLSGLELGLLVLCLWRRWWRAVEVVALGGVTALGASYLANLVPWWRAGVPLVALLGVTAVVTAVLTGLALFARGRLSRAGVACVLVAAVVVVDLLTGAHLQLSSVAGYSPLVAGRFAGLGNVAFGVLAASALLAAASTRRPALAALTGLVVVVDGAPQWGSDVGGVLALVPAYVVLVLLLSGRAASLGKLVAAAAAAVLVVTAFGVADYQRPPADRTHLGRFVAQVRDGTAGEVLRRKAEANLSLLFHSPVTALLPLVVLALAWLFLRPPGPLREALEQSPAWRAGLLSVAAAGGLGFVFNDSGAAVVGLAILVALPATVAVVARQATGQASRG